MLLFAFMTGVQSPFLYWGGTRVVHGSLGSPSTLRIYCKLLGAWMQNDATFCNFSSNVQAISKV